MLFNSPLYGAFLVATWIVFWLLRRLRLARALVRGPGPARLEVGERAPQLGR